MAWRCRVKLDDIGCCSKIPGYVRRVFLNSYPYGREVGRICTKMTFAVCVHFNRNNGDALVELFRQLPENKGVEEHGKYIHIGADDFHRLVDSHPQCGKYVVYLHGQPFLRGYTKAVPTDANFRQRCLSTIGFQFLRDCGDELAAALTYPNTVKTLEDGKEFNMLVDRVWRFQQEMGNDYGTTSEINNAKAVIKTAQEKVIECDNDLRAAHEKREQAVAILDSYGIDCSPYIGKNERTYPWL